MNEYVQLSLGTYEDLKKDIRLYGNFASTIKKEADELEKVNKKLKAYALEKSVEDYYLRYYPNDCTNPDTFYFAIQNKEELVEMGIGIDEQIEYIKQKLEKEKEEENA